MRSMGGCAPTDVASLEAVEATALYALVSVVTA
jgi:hypothetical protein